MTEEFNKVNEEPAAPEERKKSYILKFITGKFVGGIFNIPSQGELVIGRGSDSDITISEDNVSRRHAKLIVEQGNHIYIEDLGSTNGTFINGERIQRTTLMEGDRILIGTSILKLVSLQEEARPSRRITGDGARPTRKTPEPTATGRTMITGSHHLSKALEGVLGEIPLTDVIQMCSSTKKSGVLNLEWVNRSANIYIKGGSIIYAAYKDLFDMPARKALFRLMGLNEGKFTLLQYVDPPEFAELIKQPTEFLIMEGIRRLDEQNALEKDMKLRGAKLQFAFPLPGPLKKLEQEEMDIFQMLYNAVPYELLLDMSPYEDLETVQVVKKLIDLKYIRKV
jgi:pSer/pThr/pTyr-binding forkhead associated (FHA) protein